MEDSRKVQMEKQGVLQEIIDGNEFYKCNYCSAQWDQTKKPNLLECGQLCCDVCFTALQEQKYCTYHRNVNPKIKFKGYKTVIQLIQNEREKIDNNKTFQFYVKNIVSGGSKTFENVPQSTIFGDLLKKHPKFQQFRKLNGYGTSVTINNIQFPYSDIQNKTIGCLVKEKHIAEGIDNESIEIYYHNRFLGGF